MTGLMDKISKLRGPNLRKRLAYSFKRRWLSQQRRLLPQSQCLAQIQELETQIYQVSPQSIRYATLNEFNIYRDRAQIKDGDWDELSQEFQDFDFFQAFQDVQLHKKNWQETSFYSRILTEIAEGKIKWGCQNEEALQERLEQLELLYDDIRQLGYLPNNSQDEITVNIGRHGDLLFNNGRHRLTFAKLLNLESIPLAITVRHTDWVSFKCEVVRYALLHKNKVYAPLLHPDLERIPSQHAHKRFELIKRTLPSRQVSLLDIGCHWGYFCQRFENIGLSCTGVEQDPGHFYFLKKLRRANNCQFAIHNQSIFDFVEAGNNRFDITLALAIFHHFLKTEENFNRFKKMLGDLEIQEMYFQPHLSAEDQMQHAYKNFSPEEFVDFILANSCLSHKQQIGYAEDGRPLYRLTA